MKQDMEDGNINAELIRESSPGKSGVRRLAGDLAVRISRLIALYQCFSISDEIMPALTEVESCLQCFDTVGWAAGSASGL